jgi:hypothetical protein
MSPGELLVWRHTPRGGYGYSIPIPARFVAWGPFDRVKIEIVKRDGQVVRATVLDAALVRKEDARGLDCLREADAKA